MRFDLLHPADQSVMIMQRVAARDLGSIVAIILAAFSALGRAVPFAEIDRSFPSE